MSQPQQPQRPQNRQLRLELPNELDATYANAAIVSQTASEIVMDFVLVMPNDPRARVRSRVVMNPVNAKLFLRALETNLARFEEKHGEINVPPQSSSLADQLFGGVPPQADDGESE
ncbi:MAG: DUF3467 domain-containing protein [Chloroflexi bacterium]|nr:DUF3467 domain-containing protein [Chloroflexota bacterium]